MHIHDRIFCFLGGDSRMRWAETQLREAGASVAAFPCDQMTHLVLPLPAFEQNGQISQGPALEEVLPQLRSGITILGGKLGPQEQVLAGTGAAVIDYFQDEDLTAANAAVTAEGAIQLSMDRLPVTLDGTPVLVIGWGRIGQLLSCRLRALGAQVTVSARKPRDRALIAALGYFPEETGCYQRDLEQYRVIFNTVPAPVFSAAQAACTRRDCLLIELASSPGGISSDCPRPVLIAGGLPGKTAPETAGRLIGKTILRLASGQERSFYVE